MDSPARSTSQVPEQPRTSQEEYAHSRHAVRLVAAALFTDELGRVLLLKPTYRSQWLRAGGGAEPGESPEAACRREVREELGLSRDPGRVLAVHWLTPGHPGSPQDPPGRGIAHADPAANLPTLPITSAP
ncbi:NUDIX hydrolase [Streptomyces axinellae]|uniref:Nudix hydrolase domain-containing protein n=1 Tax=Streptomyces axinellae TaxID=552788 RepID=A0ABP6BX00_9ACTN